VDTFRPRCILALGGVALRASTGYAGKDCGISDLRGFIIDSPEWNLPVVPSYHPSYIRRGQADALGALMRDLKLAVQVAQGGRPPELIQEYNEVPTVQQARDYLEFLRQNPDLSIAYDIETDYSSKSSDESEALVGTGDRVTQIQFSHKAGQAIVFQWKGEYVGIAREILALPHRKLAHNGWLFDNQKLELPENGSVVVNGDVEDTMWLWHHLQPDLPKKLQFVTSFYAPSMKPWKHLAQSDMTFYGGSDVDALHRIFPTVKEQLEAEGLYESYETYVKGLFPCLRNMSRRGLPINLAGREKLRSDVVGEQQEVWDKVQEHVNSVNPRLIKLHPENGYVSRPKDLSGLVERTFRVPLARLVSCPTCGGAGTVAGKRPNTRKGCPKCHRLGNIKSKSEFDLQDVTRYCRVDGFNPAAPEQLYSYMLLRGHPVPTDKQGKRTSDDESLERLFRKTGDPLYDLTLKYRKLGKVIETYIDGKGWTPSADGRIHSQFGYGTATWQLNSRDPNVQNIPKHGEVAKRFRSLVEARAGYKLLELDVSGFHALTLGFEAQDASYMRLARLDPHSFLAGQFLKLEGHDTWLEKDWRELAEILAWIKKKHKDVRDQKAKPAMHGYGFGMGGRKLYFHNPEAFENVAEAQYIIDVLDSTFPKIVAYRERIRALAHKQTYLKSRYGAIRRFYDVYTWNNREGDWRAGEQYNEVVAFLPANDAFGKIRDAMLELEEDGSNERYNLVLNNHDSLMFECHDDAVDRCIKRVSECMESPALRLVDPVVAPMGLRAGIEASVGQKWTEMDCVYKTNLERLMAA
jgi:DNA polymerase I-like protein with 3'-5' exonuclease and polymerase domains